MKLFLKKKLWIKLIKLFLKKKRKKKEGKLQNIPLKFGTYILDSKVLRNLILHSKI